MGIQEALQLTRRIQTMSQGEVHDLAVLLEEILSQPGISSSHNTKSNADDIRLICMKEMVKTFEMGRQDIMLIARSIGVNAYEFSHLSDYDVDRIYQEAKGLYDEGHLESYLHHLLDKEEKHTLSPQP